MPAASCQKPAAYSIFESGLQNLPSRSVIDPRKRASYFTSRGSFSIVQEFFIQGIDYFFIECPEQ